MEVRLNRDVSQYSEHMFFGLTMRQTIFAAAGIAAAVAIYFPAKPVLGLEVTTWLCMLAALPFAAMGFVKVNGMNAEQYAWAFVKTNFLVPERLRFEPGDFYLECTEKLMEERLGVLKEKERKKQKKRKAIAKKGKRKEHAVRKNTHGKGE